MDHVKANTTTEDFDLRQCARALHAQNPAEAERLARRILVGNAQQPDALFFLGVALLTQHRPAEAVAPLEAAANVRADADIETHMAVALRNCGKPKEALAWFERAIKRSPPFANAFLEYGATLRSLRHYTEAETVLKRARQLAPDAPQIDMILGAVLLNRADPQGAHEAFARVLARFPHHVEALFGVGVADLNASEFARAAEHFRAVLAKEPRHVRAQLHLAHTLMELSQWDEALACLRACVQIDPSSSGSAIRMLVSAGRGHFWLNRSTVAQALGLQDRL